MLAHVSPIASEAVVASFSRCRTGKACATQLNVGCTRIQSRSLHPEKRLQEARRRALEALKKTLPQTEEHSGTWMKDKQSNSDDAVSNPRQVASRLKAGREAAGARIEYFEPVRPKKRPVQITDVSSFERPPQRRNDGTSSGAVAERRLREKTKEALEKIAKLQAERRRDEV
mmetsp:Transcript_20197/g.37986  ORF Transcript_20197/g.37986 Transcript_20197/m.37986 type:complete len:172 (-) Transcript_20197:146-661(-)